MSTITITASDINKLRQATGAGMMDCRKALTETNKELQPFNASSEVLSASGAASLAVTTTYIAAGTDTITLAAGVKGQIKVFAQTGSGSTTVTVAGTGVSSIIMNTKGLGCTLQSDGTNWWCIGNNGATITG